MRGYKIVNKQLKGRGGFQFDIGSIYEIQFLPKVQSRGFHFCKYLIDCFDHYDEKGLDKRYLEIEALGDIDNNDTTEYATNKIKIIRELKWNEVKELMFKEICKR